MNLGLLITCYDEFDTVAATIEDVGGNYIYVGVVQSGDNENLEVSNALARHCHSGAYELLPNLSDQYSRWELPAQALCRNIQRLFYSYDQADREHHFNCEYMVVITGDTRLLHNWGIEKIIVRMQEHAASIGCAIAVGQDFHSAELEVSDLEAGGGGGRVQLADGSDFMPQMFIVKREWIGSFIENLKVTNRWCSEQCLGDACLMARRYVFSGQAYHYSDGVIYHDAK